MLEIHYVLPLHFISSSSYMLTLTLTLTLTLKLTFADNNESVTFVPALTCCVPTFPLPLDVFQFMNFTPVSHPYQGGQKQNIGGSFCIPDHR